MENPKIITHIEKQVDFTLFDAKWVPTSARLVAIGSYPRGTGALQIFQMNKGELELLHKVEKPKALKCSTFGASTPEDRHLATGDFDGNLQIWDLEDTSSPVFSVQSHSSIINSVDGIGGKNENGATEIVTGGRDGCVKVWDVRQKDRPVASMEPETGQTRQDCWAVAFGNCHGGDKFVSAGFDNGDLKVFDLRNMSLHWETKLDNGICSIEFDRKDIEMNKMLACTLDSGLHVFDLRTKHPKKGYAQLKQKSHKSTIWSGKHLPQNRDVFVTTGGNGSICLWQYKYPEKRVVKGSDGSTEGVIGYLNLLEEVGVAPQPVTSFDWSQDYRGLAACTSFDQTLRVLVVTRLNLL